MQNQWLKISRWLSRLFGRKQLEQSDQTAHPIDRKLIEIRRDLPGEICAWKILYRQQYRSFIIAGSEESTDILFLLDDLRVLRRKNREQFSDNLGYSHCLSIVSASHILLANGKSRCKPIGIWVLNLDQASDFTQKNPSLIIQKLAQRVLFLKVPGFSYLEILERFDWEEAIAFAASQVLGSYHQLGLKRVNSI